MAVFIKATEKFNTLDAYVNAPLFKKVFCAQSGEKTVVKIKALGFYRIFLNGKEFTKGYLAPYISNPNQIVYEDVYDVTDKVKQGENVLCVLLGNGFLRSLMVEYERREDEKATLANALYEGTEKADEDTEDE